MTRRYLPEGISGVKYINPQKKAEMALSMLLFGCTSERLHGFTAAGLAGSYNVPVVRVEALLADARRRRPQ